jgi:hypothetical protein
VLAALPKKPFGVVLRRGQMDWDWDWAAQMATHELQSGGNWKRQEI